MAVASTRIRDLIIKHLKEEISEDEYQELQQWVHQSEENSVLFHQLMDADLLKDALIESNELKWSIRSKIDQRLLEDDLSVGEEGKLVYMAVSDRPRQKGWFYAAAAACLLIISTGGYFWLTRSAHAALAEHSLPQSKNDVAPGGDKATLTLANGATIVLEDVANGSLAVQGVSRVSKDKNLLAYTTAGNTHSANSSGLANKSTSNTTSSGNTHASDNTSSAAVVYNTLTTPRSGQFQVILPDGSKVWLNNASSLRYPTSFSGKSREVILSGEAYFEIAKDAVKPFIVRVNELAINVLGTSFNVLAYADEPAVKTTLLTGKVSLASGGKQSTLAPGEQAAIGKAGGWKISKGVDVEESIAWQRGYFHFTHEDIGAVLRQLSRWYDVEVSFTIPVPDYTFDGEIDRTLSLSAILRHLEKSDLHFQIDGRKLIVSK